MSIVIFLALLAFGSFEFGSADTNSVTELTLSYIEKIVVSEKTGAECPTTCPDGWMKWGPLKNCYKMPAKPVKFDTYPNMVQYCKDLHPDAYVLVFNEPLEIVYRLANGAPYIPDIYNNLGLNAHIWVGGQVDASGHLVMGDGSDPTTNAILNAANLAQAAPNSCLTGELANLGLIPLTRSCDSATGAAVCEITTVCP